MNPKDDNTVIVAVVGIFYLTASIAAIVAAVDVTASIAAVIALLPSSTADRNFHHRKHHHYHPYEK